MGTAKVDREHACRDVITGRQAEPEHEQQYQRYQHGWRACEIPLGKRGEDNQTAGRCQKQSRHYPSHHFAVQPVKHEPSDQNGDQTSQRKRRGCSGSLCCVECQCVLQIHGSHQQKIPQNSESHQAARDQPESQAGEEMRQDLKQRCPIKCVGCSRQYRSRGN